MRRSQKYSRGLLFAIPFALRRGHVMVFVAALLNLAEFLITGNGLFVLVRIRLARRIRAGIADIEHEFADTIAGLRLVPRFGPVSCELWLYSRHGTLRHFRVEDARLVEVDCCGTPLELVRAAADRAGTGRKDGGLTGPAAEPAGTVPAGHATGQECLSIRWLKKWNAARKAAEQSGRSVSDELTRILDAAPHGIPVQKSSGKKPGRKNELKPETDPVKTIPVSGAGETAGHTVSPQGATAVPAGSLSEESNLPPDIGDRRGRPIGDDRNGA